MQWASDLDPALNRARLDSLPTDGEPDLVVLPEAFAREFGDPSEPLGSYAEALDGSFGQALDALAARVDTTVVAGMFETSDDPERPFNTLLVRGSAEASYRKIHLYDSFGFRESDRLSAG